MVTPKMTDIDQIMKEFGDIRTFLDEKVKAGIAPVKEELDKVVKAYSAIEVGLKDLRRDRATRIEDGRLRVPSGRFAGMGFLELQALESILRYWNNRGNREPLIRRWMPEVKEARTQLYKCVDTEAVLAWEDGVAKRFGVMFPHAMKTMGGQSFRSMLAQQRTEMVQMLTKALDSTTAGAGDELVPTFESAELWMDVNLETLILPLLQQSPMPTNPYDIPTQFGDTNWYPITENVAATTTDPATAKITLTARGLKTGVPFSDEVEEDSIVPFVSELRTSLARNAAEVIDDVLLNADQTVTNGINSDGATIATTTAGKAHWLLGFDGIIHAALIDNSANMSFDANAAPTADHYNRVLSRMRAYGVGRRRGEVVYVVDPPTGLRSMAIAELETADSSMRSTLSSGEVAVMYGKPVIMSDQMRLADTDGRITDSGNATNTGRILCFNTSQWRVGFRRPITMEADREPGKGQTTLYVSFRIALSERSGTRTTQTHTSIAYDILNVTA